LTWGRLATVKKSTKQTVARFVGATAVGVGAGLILRKGFGAAFEGTVAGGVLVLLAHEFFDAPVSSWVYKHI
jgi:hypothetical protein